MSPLSLPGIACPRVLPDKEIEPDDEEFVKMIQSKYKEEYICACKIGEYIKKD